ncbi:helix-turn-helix transcriptional regulator [Thalassotalea sp. M1531]|uniref:Helix-turn-helix transcriptional regulator n=1 Tax=Thalassotalea algicola TaxID=2716224 RepID=A0A7Y0Q8M7_9GAMM|nr:metalloregulator ArsR/SmtB family transcription factor [Thalassotalea algicola]NMP32330.1 helix-turn-helix transcriptional regulator [Thalassotalea algicola]
MEVKDLDNIVENAKLAAQLLKSMSNEYRLLILCHLGGQELSVGELNDLIDISQSALSQHLARLRNEELVATTRKSQTIYYRVANPVVLKLIELLYEEFCGNTEQ